MARNRNSLLDQVLYNKDNPVFDPALSPRNDVPHLLPDGSQIYDSTIAAINRILSLNPHLHMRYTGIRTKLYQLYNSNTPVDLTDKRTLLSLIRADWAPKTAHQVVLLAEYVEKMVPVFSVDCFVVSDGLIWDRETSTLREIDKKDNIKTVS